MLVALRFACPDPGSVDLACERGLEAAIPIELDLAVDVLEQAADPGDHHVARPELRFGMTGLEDPRRHQITLLTGSLRSHRQTDRALVGGALMVTTSALGGRNGNGQAGC